MAIAASQQKAVQKYVKTHYDRIEIKLPKGSKEQIQATAEKLNLSVNAYIAELIQKDIWQRSAKDNQKD
jgi:predicted HicB family RNase H-like nuclease